MDYYFFLLHPNILTYLTNDTVEILRNPIYIWSLESVNVSQSINFATMEKGLEFFELIQSTMNYYCFPHANENRFIKPENH